MAVLSTIPGIRVTVTSGGSTLREYADDDDEFIHSTIQAPKDRISTVYIECIDDAPFEIFYEVLPGCHLLEARHTGVSFHGQVDGKRIGGASSPNVPGGWSFVSNKAWSRLNDREVAHQSLKFSTLLKLDDVDVARFNKDRKAAKGLGEILVCVHRYKQSHTLKTSPFSQAPFDSVTELSEKALKERQLTSPGFGKPVISQRNRNKKHTYPDGHNTPLAIFRFKYRSREALQQEFVIPRTPSPAPNVRAVVAQDPQERITRLKREIEKIKAEPQFKREAPVYDDDDDLHNVSSTASKRLKISRDVCEAEVIDLTDD